MHVRTINGAVLNGHRFADGTILDLPEAEAATLLDAEQAEIVGAEPAVDGEGEGEAGGTPAKRKRR